MIIAIQVVPEIVIKTILRSVNVLDGRDRREVLTGREGLIQVAVWVVIVNADTVAIVVVVVGNLRETAVGSLARLYFRAFQLLAKVRPNVRVALASEAIALIGMQAWRR